MRTPKEFILSLLSREVERAYRARDIAIDNADYAAEKSKNTSKMLDRALREIDILTKTAEHWRQEVAERDMMLCELAATVEDAADLDDLKQLVRFMMYSGEEK